MSTYAITSRRLHAVGKIGMFDLTKYAQVLGDDTPKITLSKLGRFRLLQLLRRKFGAGFKNVAQAQRILKDFETKLKIQGMR